MGSRASGIAQYLQDTRAELRKVVWPTREDATNLTIVVLVVTVVMTIILGGIDYMLGKVLAFLLALSGA